MTREGGMGVCWLLFLVSIAVARGEESCGGVSREDFPEEFVFGSGTSAYQVEGAAAEDGRSPSIWDSFAHDASGAVCGFDLHTCGRSSLEDRHPAPPSGNTRGTGDISSDEYHKYKEDVQLMKETGLEGYRFSISWSRLIPDGRGKVNPKGLEYYNNLINEIISHGIKPHVTLYHFDLPQVLQEEYEGWLSPRIVDDFTAYVDVCFREFGDRVSHWTTLNEANILALGGYGSGFVPPKRCSYPFGNCTSGNSVIEPYIVAHHCLLAHNSAASLYRKSYQAKQEGFIGLNLIIFNFLPLTNKTRDICATKRAQDFLYGWFVEPLVRGHYPKTMRKAAGKKLPRFSSTQSKQLMRSFNFIGVNYYLTLHVEDSPNNVSADRRDFLGDMSATVVEGFPPGGGLTSDTDSDTKVNPAGLQGVLEYLKQTYGNPPIYIHENGIMMPHDVRVDDAPRVKHLSASLVSLRDALRNGSDTRGYFTWSFVDLFELFGGYGYSCGLYYVDFEDTERKRYPKLSARWYSNFLRRRGNDVHRGDSSSYAPEKLTYVL